MVLTTTPYVEGTTVKQYLGIVAGEAIMGANLFRDLFASIRDVVGGRFLCRARCCGRRGVAGCFGGLTGLGPQYIEPDLVVFEGHLCAQVG